MKKLCLALAVLILISSAALADVDLSVYSFDELAALRDQIQLEMMKRDEWQEVTVPQGLWEVGTQIPEGSWVVRCSTTGTSYMMRESDIRWGVGKPENGFWNNGKDRGDISVYNPYHQDYQGQATEYIITLEKGQYIYIHPKYNSAVFTPYTGAPSFNFKK